MPRYDAASAECFVLTFREGILSAVGHDLRLRVARFSIEVSDAGEIDARFDAASLEVVCAIVADADAPNALSPKDRREIESNARDVLEARRHPEIRFKSTSVARKPDSARIEGRLTLRGVERPLTARATLIGERFEAEMRLHQPDFGIAPFRAMFGALRLRPDVVVRVNVPAGAARAQ